MHDLVNHIRDYVSMRVRRKPFGGYAFSVWHIARCTSSKVAPLFP